MSNLIDNRKPTLQLHHTSNGKYLMLVDGRFHPQLMEHDTSRDVCLKCMEIFPGVSWETIGHVEMYDQEMYVVCLRDSLDTGTYRYMGMNKKPASVSITEYVSVHAFTSPDNSVKFRDAIKFTTAEQAESAITMQGSKHEWIVAPILVQFSHAHIGDS
jgi:hypothetical protein